MIQSFIQFVWQNIKTLKEALNHGLILKNCID